MAVETARCDYNNSQGWPLGTFREGDTVCVQTDNKNFLATFRRAVEHRFAQGEAMDPGSAMDGYIVQRMGSNEETTVEPETIGKYKVPDNPDGGRRKRKTTRKRKHTKKGKSRRRH